jgi:MFS family permease
MLDPQIDYRRKWHVMAATAIGTFTATIDSGIVNVALPTLVRDFHTTFATVQWVVLAYLLTLCALLLTMGGLADMLGKRRMYPAGIIVFTVGSALCALAPSIHLLIVMRVLQAVGACMLISCGTAITTESLPPGERGKALGIHGALVSIGIITRQTLGGSDAESVFMARHPPGQSASRPGGRVHGAALRARQAASPRSTF